FFSNHSAPTALYTLSLHDALPISDCFERAEAGRGQAVSLVGDAGSGKSRLAYELYRRLEKTSFAFLKTACLPHGETAPFRIVVEDRKSTRLNSSHVSISYAVFCLK